MEENTFTCKHFEYLILGHLRFIGIDAWRTREEWDALWARKEAFLPDLDRKIGAYAADFAYDCSMMHHNGREVDTENHFLAGRFYQAGTPVPAGYDYFDLPTPKAAWAIYETTAYDGPLGAAYTHTRDQILNDRESGMIIPYPDGYWHAEVYVSGRPHDGRCQFGYLFSDR